MSKMKIGIIASVVTVLIFAVIVLTNNGFFSKSGEQNQSDRKKTENQSKTQEETADEAENNEPISIWIMGDSLAAENRKNRDAEGWGAMLQQYLKSDVIVRNAATGGASSSSYVTGGNYRMVMDGLQKGDYVIIQFGHNDTWYEDRLTDPYGTSSDKGSFKYILLNDYIKPIIKKGAHPILATSVMTCAYDENGNLYEMIYSSHAQAMRELVDECEEEEIEVTLIDTYAITEAVYRKIGEAEAWKFHTDQVHYNNYGASYVAGLIAHEMKKAGIECCQDIYPIEEVVGIPENLKNDME